MKLKVKETFAKLLDTTPIGKIVMYAGSSAPRGWLLCQGQAVSRTTYAKLFSVIGTTYGSGDGSTTFNVPDMRGRSPLGVGNGDATGHTNHTLGQKGGEETHTLTVNEMPSHRHRIGFEYGAIPNPSYGVITQYNQFGPYVSDQPSRVENTGGGQPHNIMHPYLGINFLIYVGGVAHRLLKALQSLAYRKAVVV